MLNAFASVAASQPRKHGRFQPVPLGGLKFAGKYGRKIGLAKPDPAA